MRPRRHHQPSHAPRFALLSQHVYLLHTLVEEAEAALGPGARARLAGLIESFVATHEGAEPFTDDERAHLARLDAEPFEPADPEAVAALFARKS